MKVGFFHDSILKYDKKKDLYYTSGGLSYSYLGRYLQYFDSVLMVTRREMIGKKDNVSKLSITSGKKIEFDCMDGFSIKKMASGDLKKHVRKALKKVDYAIIRLPSFIGIAACRECEKMKKPYLVEMVASPFCALWYYGKLSYKILAPFYALANKRCVKKSRNVIYVTKEYLQRHYPNLHNNIGISDVNIQESDDGVLDKRSSRIERYDSATIYKIGLIGSMDVKYKGHGIAIKSLPILKKRRINVELHFLGKCSEASRSRLMKLARKEHVSDSVFIDGVLPGGHDVLKWIDDKDMIILPSKQEGLPRSLVEAMSRAVVCVGTTTGGIPELLQRECIMKQKNAKGLADTISYLINDKNKMKKISKINYDTSKKFDIVKLNHERDEFFSKIFNSIASKRVNVLNIANGLDVGGAETIMMNILRTIDRERFQLHYLCYSEKPYDYEREAKELGAVIHRMKRGNAFHDIKAIRKVLKQNDINVIHCHTHYNSVFGVIAGRLSRIKVIVHSHTAQDIVEKTLVEKIYHRVSRRIINKYSDYFFACGEKAADALFDNKEKVVIINNGVVLSDFSFSSETRKRVRKELGVSDDATVIGHIGRFAKSKNHSFLLDVFQDYCKVDKDAILVLVGVGELFSSIKEKAKTMGIYEKIKFLGLRMDTNYVYNAMDIVLFPSLFEGMPTTLIEAQMNGLPIVASDVIDPNINIAGRIEFVSLKASVGEWVSILKKNSKGRYDGAKYFLGGRYDMANVVKKIEAYYER